MAQSFQMKEDPRQLREAPNSSQLLEATALEDQHNRVQLQLLCEARAPIFHAP